MFSDTRYSIDEMCMIVSGTLRFLTSIRCRVLSAAAKRQPKDSGMLLVEEMTSGNIGNP